jgi:hypothetical protein
MFLRTRPRFLGLALSLSIIVGGISIFSASSLAPISLLTRLQFLLGNRSAPMVAMSTLEHISHLRRLFSSGSPSLVLGGVGIFLLYHNGFGI